MERKCVLQQIYCRVPLSYYKYVVNTYESMVNADDILMPLTLDERTARLQKRIDEAEEVFPGLLIRAREWVRSDDFKDVLKEVPELTEKSFRMSRASYCMVYHIAVELAGMPTTWQPDDDRSCLIKWITNCIWQTEGMHKKYYENVCSRYHI